MDSPLPADVYSLSDQIGFGNWGSVWLCRPKSSKDGRPHDQKIAVKLVHRSKTSTTAARIRSLWNEMKIVRTFKSDPHPSIIPFHSFIITPSYALITMAYLPTLVPVEVDELKAREWFRYLLSGVEFLHKRGVVHNDIKPANILLSRENVPVLVDFGFAEKYDLKSETAFHSNLSYGTPELRGKWVGEWRMSKSVERMLRRMIMPNADLRCTVTQAMNDQYWAYRKENATSPSPASHRRSSSYASSMVFEKDVLRLMETPRPFSEEKRPKSAAGIDRVRKPSRLDPQVPQVPRVRSQPKLPATKRMLYHFPYTPKTSRSFSPATPRKRVPPTGDLSPVKASPPASPFSRAAGKENIRTFNAVAASTPSRRPLSPLVNRENLVALRVPSAGTKDNEHRKSRVLGDSTSRYRNAENVVPQTPAKKKDPVRDRVREWERERERMREMARLEEIERDRDEAMEREREEEERAVCLAKELAEKKERPKVEKRAVLMPPGSPVESFSTYSSNVRPSSANGSNMSFLKHNLRKSIDKTMNLYKSTASQLTGRSTPLLTVSSADDEHHTKCKSDETSVSWEEDVRLQNAPSLLSSVRQAAEDERVAADARMDRLTIWMRNVEKVVEDARQSFVSSSTHEIKTLPSPPVAPLSHSQGRTNRSSVHPRNVLPASEIFANEQSFAASGSCVATTDASLQLPEVDTPMRKRRATVSDCLPEKVCQTPSDPDGDAGSPSKRREKSKSHGNLLQLHIAPISMLDAELNKTQLPAPPPSAHRLSDVLDSRLFIAPPLSPQPPSSPQEEDQETDMRGVSLVKGSRSYNDLDASPLHVEPYPTRCTSMQNPPHDSATQRHVEGVYDRLLMATSGVKRLGKGYQSDSSGVTSASTKASGTPVYHPRPEKKVFQSTRKPMPPAVSSDNMPTLVDELGVLSHGPVPIDALAGHTILRDDGKTTVAFVRRAFKAIVPKTPKRLSRNA
ncbi:hypothetical protein C0992_005060 [Termitomyces sp. T32_za158]|nr:hypothetical protein C0992_005060 [Termitomyces sp. T32_za158]